jgi:hypothetical protein
MTRRLAGFAVMLALVLGADPAPAQQATERYIPIGRSPGLSQKYTSMGEIVGLDTRAQTITIADPAGPRTVKVTGKTRIWLDRTGLKQTNLSGSFADLAKGRRVEVKYLDPETRQLADWVKVEITEP